MTKKDRFSYLFKRYVDRKHTPEEKQELMARINSGEYEEQLSQLASEVWSGEIPAFPTEHEEARADEIFSGIMRRLKVKKMNIRLRYVAAAAITLLIFGAGMYFLLPHKQNQESVVADSRLKFGKDLPPGGNKAVLTLANGSIILLDSARSGTLALQGHTRVVKLTNGGLTYKTSEGVDLPDNIQYNTLTTPRGGQYQLRLPDGTKVWLNAASSIRYPTAFTGKERSVEIAGEAYFEVAPRADRPFKVHANGLVVEVLGTHFNINAYEDEAAIKTTLLQGRVKVVKGGSVQVLSPGQQAVWTKNGKMEWIKEAPVSQAIAWKEGRFEFNGNIQGIMRQIARWYNVQVEYRGDVTGKAFGGAISRYENVSKVLKMLELTGSIHFEIEDNTVPGHAGKIIVKP